MAKLIFRYGSMNASKSANLIMDLYSRKAENKSVLAFKSTLDTRDYGYITSRALETQIPSHLISPEMNGAMYAIAGTFMPEAIYIDEVHFLSKEQIEEVAKIVNDLEITVHAYGLMTDFRSELFEGSKRLIELADIIERIRSECTQCSNQGLMNARFVGGVLQTNGETVVVGAEQTYKVLCRKCYTKQIEEVES